MNEREPNQGEKNMKLELRAVAFFSVLLAFRLTAAAAPAVSSVSGTAGTGQTLRINGSSFGVKSPAAPYVWADFEGGENPSPLGQKTSWDGVQSLAWSTEGFNGSRGMKATDSSGFWTIRSNYDSWTRENQKVYIYKKQRLNFQITSTSQNWKTWRMWPPTGTNYPNIYTAANNGRAFVENIGTESGFWGNFKTATTNWATEEIIFKASSGINLKDGILAFRVNGKEQARGTVITRSSQSPAYMKTNYVVHAVLANKSQWSPAWSSNNRVWVDDVYVDTTWARVMIGDASTFASCTTLDIQIPSAWSDGSITVTANTRSFASGARAYLYVFDRDGNPNRAGYPITIGSGTAPTNRAPVVSAGPDINISLGASAALSGSVSDDGLPNPPASVSNTWSHVSGPATSQIASPSSRSTSVSFPVAGTYVLRLTASDGALTAFDDLTVVVSPPNQAPVVDAGPDASATAGISMSLAGRVTDDNLPAPAALSVAWSSVSGPATPVIAEVNSLSTQVTFPTAGTYTLRLTVSDGALSGSDTLVVTVAPPAVGNVQPWLFAGDDQVVYLPNRADLSGAATDDGLPVGGSLTYSWAKVSGPGTVGFGNIAALATWASFSAAGTYVISLSVGDGELTSVDHVQIDVRPQIVATSGPTVLGVSGRLAPGGTLSLSGANFGVKSPAAPYLWADFELGMNPSPLGVQRTWGEVQNMTWTTEGFNSTRGVKASDGNGVWTMRVDYSDWTRDGQRAYIYKKQRANFRVTSDTQNWKIWRMWPSTFGYPNVYAASNNGRVYVENIGTESGFWGDFRQGTTNWSTEEISFQASSAIGKKDGLLVIRYDGVEKSRGSLLTKSAVSPSPMTLNYVVHGVAANKGSWSPSWSTANRMWVDDVYVDTTWARVMIGDASTYAASRRFEPQIPTAWSNGSITVSARPGSFAKGSRVYVYVFDKDGKVNADGYPIIVDTQGAGSLVDGGHSPEFQPSEAARNVFNPIRGETANLAYALKQRGSVKVLIYDRGGRRVKELVGDERLEGEHTISWDGRNDDGALVASGIYIAVAKGSEGSKSRHKIAVIK